MTKSEINKRNPTPGRFVFSNLKADEIRENILSIDRMFDKAPVVTMSGIYALANNGGYIDLDNAEVKKISKRYVTVDICDGLETQVDPYISPDISIDKLPMIAFNISDTAPEGSDVDGEGL